MMKAVITVEMFDEESRRKCNSLCNTLPVGRIPPSSWVAEITGRDMQYTFQREFMPFKLDYSKSNSKGSRGIYREYVLETGHIYEVKERLSWGSSERYFCMVSDDGDIVHLDEIDVRRAFGVEESG